MKSPKPWHWKARGAWYVQINKKQIRLHENEKEANKEFYRLMAANGKLGATADARTLITATFPLALEDAPIRPNGPRVNRTFSATGTVRRSRLEDVGRTVRGEDEPMRTRNEVDTFTIELPTYLTMKKSR